MRGQAPVSGSGGRRWGSLKRPEWAGRCETELGDGHWDGDEEENVSGRVRPIFFRRFILNMRGIFLVADGSTLPLTNQTRLITDGSARSVPLEANRA
jgi:hypothetical protein